MIESTLIASEKLPQSCLNMLAVASGKGGVGKTWLSVTLSQALARQGKRVLLFDGDLGLANVDIQLGLQPSRDLGGALAGQYALAKAATRHPDAGFEVIAGRSGTGGLASLPGPRLAGLLHDLADLSTGYDRVVLDLGAGLERTVRQLAALAQTNLIVATDEPTSLTDAYAFIKLAHQLNPKSDIRVVINMAGSPAEGERTYATLLKACESFLKISPPLAGVIRRDPKVKDAIRHQVPLLTRHPACEAADDVEKLAGRLIQRN
ncbi:MinD/ParA family protein [Pelagibius litoralis]|uniref:MinD/ParA family protein n=1 Tax=Pelagibius litoralis TaxID=374515 RepID=A0A967EY10_9PROT|nr:MinD/ParA family protein [Pelagibius litoralis]NIA69490.1 MinD/ParA family protein [Pelagibius litoralis]